MKRASWTPFLLILLLPILALGWMGYRMAQDEQKILESRYKEVLTERLHSLREPIDRFIEEREWTLYTLLHAVPRNRDEIRMLMRNTGIISQVFLLDHQGKLVYPSLQLKDLSEGEERFIHRTLEIWQRKDLSYYHDQETSTLSKNSLQKNGQRVPPGKGIWHPFFWGNGLHLLYFRRSSRGDVLGVELSRYRLIADLIGELPDRTSFHLPPEDTRILLTDSNGSLLYQWGEYDIPSNQEPIAELSLPEPLASWKLAYHLRPGVREQQIGKPLVFSIVSGMMMIILALLGLALYFYREHSRELRDAGQKVNFVNQVSHELKTPLTNIRMYAELLENNLDEEDEKNRRYLEVIVTESQRLSRLIGNVLTFGKKEKDKLKLRKSPCLLSDVISEVVDHFRPGLEEKGITVNLSFCDQEQVIADEDALQQIIGNLISNVEKYAYQGGQLSISLTRDGDYSLITVTDRGPGIAKEQVKKAFQPFCRLSDALSEGVSGAGIGLSIARELARLHDGDLILLPSEQGAVFQLKILTPAPESGNWNSPGEM